MLLLMPLAMFAASDLNKEVRHELVMLPYYNVFDNLSYRVDGSKVTLFGQVRLPRLKDRLGMIPMEPGSLVMERKMLRGIKERAERLVAESPTAGTGR